MRAVNAATATNNPDLASTPGRAALTSVGLVLVSGPVGEATAVGVWPTLLRNRRDEMCQSDERKIQLTNKSGQMRLSWSTKIR